MIHLSEYSASEPVEEKTARPQWHILLVSKRVKKTTIELNSLPSPPMFTSWSCIVMTHNSCKVHSSPDKGSTNRKSEYVLSFSLLPYFSCLLWISMISANAFFFFFHCYSTPRASLQSPGSSKVLWQSKENSHQNVWPYVTPQSNTIQARNFSTILFSPKRTFVTHLHTFSGCLNAYLLWLIM